MPLQQQQQQQQQQPDDTASAAVASVEMAEAAAQAPRAEDEQLQARFVRAMYLVTNRVEAQCRRAGMPVTKARAAHGPGGLSEPVSVPSGPAAAMLPEQLGREIVERMSHAFLQAPSAMHMEFEMAAKAVADAMVDAVRPAQAGSGGGDGAAR